MALVVILAALFAAFVPDSHAAEVTQRHRIVVDASRGGGVWWKPQPKGLSDPTRPHGGKPFVDYLKSRGWEVEELRLGDDVTERLGTASVVIRANFVEHYSDSENLAYRDYVEDGGSLFLVRHQVRGPGWGDTVATQFGIRFAKNTKTRTIRQWAPHPFTSGLPLVPYRAGCIVVDRPESSVPFAYLDPGQLVMGMTKHGQGKIIFLSTVQPLLDVSLPLMDRVIEELAGIDGIPTPSPMSRSEVMSTVRGMGGQAMNMMDPQKQQVFRVQLGYRTTDASIAQLSRVPDLYSLHLGMSQKVTDAGLVHLGDIDGLKELEVFNRSITDAGVAHIAKLAQLEKLSFSQLPITDAALAHVAKLTQLRQLRLSSARITDAGLRHLSQLHQLEHLQLSGYEISDDGLMHLNGLQQLTYLSTYGRKITDAGLAHLKGLGQLTHLSLNNAQISDDGLAHIKDMPQLQWLTFNGSRITDAGLKNLRQARRLRGLSFGNARITDNGLAELKPLTELSSLHLSRAPVTGDGLKHLVHLKQLSSLWLDGTQVAGPGLEYLSELPNLSDLHLGDTQVSDAGMEYLRGLPQLDSLYLYGTHITDAGLECLEGMTRLSRLDFRQMTAITDAGLRHLEGMNNLSWLELSGTGVTKAGVSHLKSKLPRVNIGHR